MRLKADITLFVIAVIWGSAFVAQRVAGQLGSVYLFNGARYILAGLVVIPFAWRTVRTVNGVSQAASLTYMNRDQFKWMVIAGFLLFVAAALQQVGVVYTTAGNAGFITSLYVVLVPIVLFLGWRERPHWLSVVAVGMAVVGAFFLSTGGRLEVRRGDALELAGALFWAVHVVVLGKFATRFEPMSFSVGQLLVCGLLNLVLGLFVEQPVFTWPLAGAVIYTAVMSLGLCYTLQVWAQRHTPPSDAALLLSLESVFAVIAGWLLLNELLTGIQILGCVIIFLAVGLSQLKSYSGTIDRDHLVEGR
ncbi:MAG: EamA family transporter [Anaerolineales bacterium]|nr:DMT family transporter [Anaerolineae bacterium]PWB77948.1 MAG: EamA family transporter [Anaerolineales bacterium]